MTLTSELDLHRVAVNQHTIPVKSHLVQKLLSGHTHTHTHTHTDTITGTTALVRFPHTHREAGKSSTSFGWGNGGNVTSAGWQVILCDPIRHVSSRSGEASR